MNDQNWQLHRPVVLVGMMGSGKTSVGRTIAQALSVPFLDSDHEIELAANATIAEVFARDGEAFFRDRETSVIGRLLDGPPAILSTGGGAWLRPENRALIQERGVAVWLDADADLLWSRVKGRDTRPLLRTENPRATLIELLEARLPSYRLADIHVAAHPTYSLMDMAEQVIDALSARSDILTKGSTT